VTPTLIVRCKENRTELYVRTGMNAAVEYGEYESATVTLRFDKDEAVQVKCGESTDGEALFFPNAISMLKLMMSRDKMLFQFTPFNASPQMTTFPLTGLAAAVAPLRRACGW
jgi:type VI secretion system protein VasI